MIEILETDNVNLGRQKANTNFETIQTHLDNQENPHGVTAVQAGALPLAAWSTVWEAGQDLNTVLTTGTYAAPTNAIAAACTNLPEGYTASGQAVERHAMSKKGSETKKAEKSRENIKKAQFYVEFHAKPGDKLQKGA